ncbi:MAG: amino acid permease [Planctomycetota bacterium]|jgi:APA family basic amino acid/polyamine antiporter|nr:amino acid permease [Planctomycetota bacterium]
MAVTLTWVARDGKSLPNGSLSGPNSKLCGYCVRLPAGSMRRQPMTTPTHSARHIGLTGATGIGVGAIVGGGILALSGMAFQLTGSGALLAFALNGVIAVITALSFAELATAFPQSGGPYAFAKRVLPVGTAFAVGWVVWFASIVAAALYAAGFAAFALDGLQAVIGSAWLTAPWTLTICSIGATAGATAFVARSSGAGGNAVNIAKVLVFAILIIGGVIAVINQRPDWGTQLSPFLPKGGVGLIQAMGGTFIALQGFDLIAAVAGEVKNPRQVLPKAMLLSLGIALVVYLPLLLVVALVGVDPEVSIQQLAEAHPNTVIAVAAARYLGTTGYWAVIAAGVLSMASALLANLFAAARIAQAMGRDRTLPAQLDRVHKRYGTPVVALLTTASIATVILLVAGEVGTAGAASSLIFLLAFALAHVLCLVTRSRKQDHEGFRVPWWPWTPIIGGLLCAALAIYQAMMVPSAGVITVVWLLAGAFGYAWRFGQRAKIMDAASEAADPSLLELRGRSPLVLVPVANPDNAGVMAQVANSMAPPRVGRVLLLSVVRPPKGTIDLDAALADTTAALHASLSISLRAGVRCEALATVAANPWQEIARVARSHRCASLLVGLSALADPKSRARLEHLATELSCNVVFFRAEADWTPKKLRRVLVPIGGRTVHDALRARLLAGLNRRSDETIEVTYLVVDPSATEQKERSRRELTLTILVRDEAAVPAKVTVLAEEDIAGAICREADKHDLLIMGLGAIGRGQRTLGSLTQAVIERTRCTTMLISAGD